MSPRLDITQDTQPLAIFRDNADKLIEQLEATDRTITLTVDGQPKVVLQNPAAYQRLLELAALADPEEGIRQGLEDVRQGRTRPAREFFAEMRNKYDIPG
jgi:PHD/YefM family antitoxin component YafN of YafNO toxin-antitoxin module